MQEYWQFDPKGEWISEQLRGYRWQEFISSEGEVEPAYLDITDGISQVLKLRLVAEGRLISFYRLDTGEKLLIPEELAAARQQEAIARQQAEALAEAERQRADALEAEVSRYRSQFGELPES